MLVRVVGLGPGDPSLLTVGAIDALRACRRSILLLAPNDLCAWLEAREIILERHLVHDASLLVRGGSEEMLAFTEHIATHYRADTELFGIGILGNPLSDFPGLPQLVRAFDAHGITTEIIPGVPRATLSASLNMPLVPLPPQSTHYTFDGLVEVMARLRQGCPWDREQTHRTLVPYLIEETYEVVEAIESNDVDALCDELGDLLLQIVFHAQLGSETGKFTVADVIDALANKMVRRHPHVFSDAIIEDVDAQWKNWELLKSKEKTGLARKSRLDGIPVHLGALQRGQRMQEKAARVGFDWRNIEGVLDKMTEELTELAQARRQKHDDPHVREELGDVFFTLVNLSRVLGIDAETAVREANDKFYRRFSFIETCVARDGKAMTDLSLEQLEDLWQQSKVQPV